MVWSYAAAGAAEAHRPLFFAIAQDAPRKVHTFNAQELANTAWAFSTLGFEAPTLFEAIAAESVKKIKAFTSQNLANTVWAFANVGAEAPLLFEAVAFESPKKLATFTPLEVANTAWAFSLAGYAAPALFDAVAPVFEARLCDWDPFLKAQFHQVFIHLRLEAPQHALTLLLGRHETDLKAAFLAKGPTPSQGQTRCSAALVRIGWTHEFEHVTADGLRLDMAQPLTKVAVEFDGPAHYLIGLDGAATRSLNGKSVFKDRVLARLRWKLVRVPYFDWVALRTDAARDDYLRRVL
mmetsp:Transcript_7086/g.24902  ORF Transcript_7086/g.24902 Transcript_7086/m.24902 type:complete len:294 (-) Transcript_7086:58-939(-)